MLKIEPIQTGSDGNLYIIKCNNVYYLLECGLKKKDILRALFSKNLLLSNFKGCFVSHRHNDHILGAELINQFMPIYSNRQVMEEKKFDGEILEPKRAYCFNGDLCVMPFNVEHGNAENYGYMFRDRDYKILFITDVFKFEDVLKPKFDEIFIECNWTMDLMSQTLEETKDTPEYKKFERQYQTHCSLDNLKLILENSLDLSNCKKITLIHPSKEVCNKELVLNELRGLYPNISIEFAKNQI